MDDNGSSDASCTATFRELQIIRRRWREVDKRLQRLEAFVEKAEPTLERLNKFLDKDALREAREQNWSLRRGVPLPFCASRTHSPNGAVFSTAATAGMFPAFPGGVPFLQRFQNDLDARDELTACSRHDRDSLAASIDCSGQTPPS